LFLACNQALASCESWWDWARPGCERVVDTYKNGDNELMLSGYSYHLPSTWTPEHRAELNSNAWGIGWAKTLPDPNNGLHTVFAMAFKHSHNGVQWNVGYERLYLWGAREKVQVGGGYAIFIFQRSDIANGIPVPAILPTAVLRHGPVTFHATYIPTLNGGVNHGSTLFMFGSIALP